MDDPQHGAHRGRGRLFLLYLPTASPFYVVVGVLLMVAATAAAVVGYRRDEQ